MDYIAKKQEVSEFLEAVGWRDIISPGIEAERLRINKALIESIASNNDTLGAPQYLVGKIHGLDWVEQFITKVIEQGTKEQIKVFNSTNR